MKVKTRKFIERLRAIEENIDTLGLNDAKGWHRTGAELEKCCRGQSDLPAVFDDLMPRCLQAIGIIADQKTSQTLALVGAVCDALAALAAVVEGADGAGKTAGQALQEMDRLLEASNEDGDATGDAPDDCGHPVIHTLDDAAAFLMQLEPEDDSGWQHLQAAVRRMAEEKGAEGPHRPCLQPLVEYVEGLEAGSQADFDARVAQVGRLIEEAIEAAENEQRRKPPAKASGKKDVPPDPVAEAAEAGAGKAAATSDPETDCMPEEADADLLGEFISESNELINAAEEALLSLEVDPDDTDAVAKVFRAFHTVKGTSAFMELNLIAELGHHAETLLSRVRDQEIRYAGGYADLSLRALDMIKELIGRVEQALGGAPLLKPDGYDDLMDILIDPEAAGVSESGQDVEPPRVGDMLVAQGKADREKVEAAVEAHPDKPVGTAVTQSKTARVTDVGKALRAQKKIKGVESTVRVSTERLDKLIDMVGELVIAHSMVARDTLLVDSSNHELQKKVSHTSKIVRELQDISMSMRMVPLKATFNKMARLVRDLSRKVGKSVNFVTEGEDTEIDRNLVDVINDPLVHMVRNAVDHGIEPPEERERAGKPPQGQVRLCAYHSAGSVVVEVRDDGKGLDREGILAKARERGLVGPEADVNECALSDRDVYNLIFEAGFSTAQSVTDVSGRGVGMDVVKRNLESLRGQAEIKSEPGQGSVFKMSIPLTLAIIDGMVVRVGKENYVIPTVSIVSSLKPEEKDVTTVLKRGEMLKLQGSLIPLVRLANVFDVDDNRATEKQQRLVVVVEDEDGRTGLIIDELLGRQQVVIKSLGETMRNIPGISGGAIMPNGRVGLILDIGGLVRFANRTDRSSSPDACNGETLAA